MTSGPERWDPRADGPLDEAALRAKLKARGYRVARWVYPPGTVFPEHVHAEDKLDAVLSGRFRITTPAGAFELEPGDLLAVPRGTPHTAEVLGERSVVSLDGVRSGR